LPRSARARLTRAALLGLWAAGAGCMPASWGASALLLPYRKPLAATPPIGTEELEIDSDGLKLRGWRFRAKGERRGTIVYLHGNGDNRGSAIGIGERFSAVGFDVVAFDSRAQGQSEGRFCTYGFYEKQDLRRVIDQYASGPVVLLGVSLGGAVALQAAATDERVVAVISVASYSDLRTIVGERLPFFASRRAMRSGFALAEQQAEFKVDDVSPRNDAARIRVPVLLIHGERDVETRADHSRRIFEAVTSKKKLIVVPGAGHGDSLRPEVWTEIDRFIEEALV
jgi:uncharacterized protein